MNHPKYILISKFCDITGYTDDAVRAKIKKGVWLEGRHYIYSPDGHVQINIEEYETWVEMGVALRKRQARATKSPLPIEAKDAANESNSSPAQLIASG